MGVEAELSAGALDIPDLDAKREALRKEHGARLRAFSGFKCIDEAAAAYFAAGLERDVFRALAQTTPRSLSTEQLAERLSVDKGVIAAFLEKEAKFSKVVQKTHGRWQLDPATGHPGTGQQEIWPSMRECLQKSPKGLSLKARTSPSS